MSQSPLVSRMSQDDCQAGSSAQLGTRSLPPGEGALARSLRERIAHRFWYERSLALDRLGDDAFIERRRAALAKIPGAGYLVEQYGLLTAAADPSDNMAGLRTVNAMSAKYQRTQSATSFFGACYRSYADAIHPEEPLDATYLMFANSVGSAERFLKWFSEALHLSPRQSPANLLVIHPGLVAIELNARLPEELATLAPSMLRAQGGVPSLYRVVKHYAIKHIQGRHTPECDGEVDNVTSLEEMFTLHLAEPLAVLDDLPQSHPLRSLSRVAVSLVSGLTTAMRTDTVDENTFRASVFAEHVLLNIATVVRTLPSLAFEAPRFFSAYAVLMEEIFLILASTQPYQHSDYKEATSKQFLDRIGNAAEGLTAEVSESYLVSSGMQACVLALEVAKQMIGGLDRQVDLLTFHEDGLGPLYFEIPSLCKNDFAPSGTGRIVLAMLNGSAATRKHSADETNAWNVDKLIGAVRRRIEYAAPTAASPLVLILDRTVEKKTPDGLSELSEVIGAFREDINAGRLILFLFRSYQKYQSLASAKIMAGEVMVLAPEGEAAQYAHQELSRAESELDWFANDECQLLTHFLVHAQSRELELLDAAAGNAAFIHRHCFQPEHGLLTGFDAFEPGLPFGVLDNARAPHETPAEVKIRGAEDTTRFSIQELLAQWLSRRNSFAFAGTTWSALGLERSRISIGHESRDELVEKFYALGWIKKQGTVRLTMAAMTAHARQIAADGADIVLARADVRKWAPVAIRILERRDQRSDERMTRCDELLEDLLSFEPFDTSQLEDTLRTLLIDELAGSGRERTLTEDMMILGAAFAPVVAGDLQAEDSAYGLQLSAVRDPAGLEQPAEDAPEADHQEYFKARYGLSMIASMLTMATEMFISPSATEAMTLSSAHDMALASGLPGFSSGSRETVVKSSLHLRAGMVSPTNSTQVREWAHEMLHAARLVPNAYQKASILLGMPDRLFSRLDQDMRRKLVEQMLLPLDAETALRCLRKLVEDDQVELAVSFRNAIVGRIADALDGTKAVYVANNLEDAPWEGEHELTEMDDDALIRYFEAVRQVTPWADAQQ